MKTLKTLIASIALACLSIGAQAAGTGTGTITGLYSMANGAVLVFTSATSTPASCNTSGAFAIMTASSDAGKSISAYAAYAGALGKTVTIVGAGTCTAWSGYEDISFIAITN